MASGNFLIGKGVHIAVNAFNEYVQPYLKKQGYEVKDKIQVPHPDNEDYYTVLVSLTGKGDLEKKLNTMLCKVNKNKAAGEAMKREDAPAYKEYLYAVVTHENKGQFRTIGVYDDDNTASQLFPTIAQEFLVKRAKRQVTELKGVLNSFLNRTLKSFID